MSDDNAVELIKRSNGRFSRRERLDTFRQEVALNFAPWLAEWTTELQLGDDYAAHLIDGTPLLLARDFVGQIGAMLRPPGKQWFWHRTALDSINNDRESREYLDWRSQQQLRIMTDRVTGFHRATKQADEFFGLMGDAVLSVDTDDMQESLRMRCWHTKNVVWAIGSDNHVDTVTRREHVPARVLKQRYRQPKDKLHQKILEQCEKDGDHEFEIRHEVLPAREYDAYIKRSDMRSKDGFVSVWIDVQNNTVIRETYTKQLRYIVPRWVSLTGSPYGISPATTIALPDARLIQQQAVAILEAAEKSINPPLIAQTDTIRGDVRLESLGITWVDRTYDERNGAPLVPLELGKNFQLGVETLLRTENQLARAFYLDKLRLPDTRNSKSTVEVQFMIDEYVRAALPLFAPMQAEYNDAMLFEVDKLIDSLGGYSERELPQPLRDKELLFAWDNPLGDMIERQQAQRVSEVAGLANTVAALDAAAQQSPTVAQIDTRKMFREAAIGLGASGWLLDEDDVDAEIEGRNQANKQQAMLGAAPNIAQLIDSGVGAAQAAAEIPQQSQPGFSMPLLPEPV